MKQNYNYREFIKEPKEFSKYSDKKLLQYCVGANLYMPSNKDIYKKVINKEIEGLTTLTMCFEDAIREEDVPRAENNVRHILDEFHNAVKNKLVDFKDIPLIFLRVRNVKQFISFTKSLKDYQFKYLCGFIFPKFNIESAEKYLSYLSELNLEKDKLYAMPILESKDIMNKENRISELINIKKIIDKYSDIILNIRVGATDFSSLYGIRRPIHNSIYDVNVVNDCLTDIVNVFHRKNETSYVISAPVWEYFNNYKNEVKTSIMYQINNNRVSLEEYLNKHEIIFNKEVDGLLREALLDKLNGFIGKTVIHPSQIKYVNAIYAVTEDEYNDAKIILKHQGGGVLKGSGNNKMNEMNPHLNWAKDIFLRAKAYGVIKNNSFINLML